MQWGVPPGTERRWFLFFWYSVCCANGAFQTQTAYLAWAETHTWGHLAVLISQVIYTALFACLLIPCVLFKSRTYQQYKLLLDRTHLCYCLVTHLLSACFPAPDTAREPGYSAFHLGLFLTNALIHNLSPGCHFALMVPSISTYLVMNHMILRSHFPHMHMYHYGYLKSQAIVLTVPALLATLFYLILGRADMPPESKGQSKDSMATQALLIFHRLQVHVQANMHGLIIIASVPILLWHFLHTMLAAMSGKAMMSIDPFSSMLVVLAAYTFGTVNVLSNIQPKLQGALNLLYDLVPAHIAQALLHQAATQSKDDRKNKVSSSASRSSRAMSSSQGTSPAVGEHVSSESSRTMSASTGRDISAPTSAPLTRQLTTLTCIRSLLTTSPTEEPPSPPSSASLAVAHTLATLSSAQQRTLSESLTNSSNAGSATVAGRRRSSGGVGIMGERLRSSNTFSGLLNQIRAAVGGDEPLAGPGSAGEAASALTIMPSGVLFPKPGLSVYNTSVPDALTKDGVGGPGVNLAMLHESCSVIFADIVGFTECSMCVTPAEVMAMLNELFERYDSLCMEGTKVYKVETIGDCIMAATGLLHDDPDHAITALQFGADLIREANQVLMPHNGQPVHVRVGIHSGRVISGVVGRIRKRYCLFGDTVNTASRMESNSLPGHVHISSSTYELAMASPAHESWSFDSRGEIPIKGKPPMSTYFATQI